MQEGNQPCIASIVCVHLVEKTCLRFACTDGSSIMVCTSLYYLLHIHVSVHSLCVYVQMYVVRSMYVAYIIRNTVIYFAQTLHLALDCCELLVLLTGTCTYVHVSCCYAYVRTYTRMYIRTHRENIKSALQCCT